MLKKSLLKKMGIFEEVERYVDILIKKNIKPQKIILFGSFAKNKIHPYSDIDLAVISDQFGKDELKEMMTLSKLTLQASDRIEAIPIEEKYFLESRYHPLIGEIKKYGKVIYSSN